MKMPAQEDFHPSVTVARVVRAVKADNNIGICITCGRKAKGFVEPDAESYTCAFKSCGKPTVYGAEQLLFIMVP